MSSTILTNSGKYFYFDNPEAHDFPIREIAHALSHLCRYTGHVRRFYSVAQHCVLVSRLVPVEYALEGLMHDAAEAYLGDVASPLKRLLPDYKTIEHRVERAINTKYALMLQPESLGAITVKQADIKALLTEKRDLMPRGLDNTDWGHWPDVEPDPEEISPLPPHAARHMFLRRYAEITYLKGQ